MRGIGVKSLAVVFATGVITACGGAGDWFRAYTEAEEYSYGEDVYIAKGGQVIVSGRLGPDSAFTAAYSTAGELLWDQRVAENGVTYAPGAPGSIVQDAPGNIYLARPEIQNSDVALKIYKSNAQGDEITSWVSGINYRYVLSRNLIQLLNNKLYVSGSGSEALEVYDLQGGLIWRYSLNPVGSSTSRKMVQSPLVRQQNTIVVASDKLVELDAYGAETRTVLAEDLGLLSISQATLHQSDLIVVGPASAGAKTVVLSDSFSVESSNELVQSASQLGQFVSKGGIVCGGPDYNESVNRNSYAVTGLSGEGASLWEAMVPVVGTVQNAILQASESACLLQLVIKAADGTLTSKVMRFDTDGNTTGVVSFPDFFPSNFAVNGNTVYQNGITGEYDGFVTMATLVKQHF